MSEDTKICAGGCGRLVMRRAKESAENFAKRRTCGQKVCAAIARVASNARLKDTTPPDPAWPKTWPDDMRFEDHPGAR